MHNIMKHRGQLQCCIGLHWEMKRTMLKMCDKINRRKSTAFIHSVMRTGEHTHLLYFTSKYVAVIAADLKWAMAIDRFSRDKIPTFCCPLAALGRWPLDAGTLTWQSSWYIAKVAGQSRWPFTQRTGRGRYYCSRRKNRLGYNSTSDLLCSYNSGMCSSDQPSVQVCSPSSWSVRRGHMASSGLTQAQD